MKHIGIDPGTEESAMVSIEGNKIREHLIAPNHTILKLVREKAREDVHGNSRLAIEMVESFGMPVGREVFETVLWIGRFAQRWIDSGRGEDDLILIGRKTIKLELCNSPRAKDPNIRQALKDVFGDRGTKNQPGGTYGIASHKWSALAVAWTCRTLMKRGSAKK